MVYFYFFLKINLRFLKVIPTINSQLASRLFFSFVIIKKIIIIKKEQNRECKVIVKICEDGKIYMTYMTYAILEN